MIYPELLYVDTVPTQEGDVEFFRSPYTGAVRMSNVPLDWHDPRSLRAFGRACVRMANDMELK
jgi:hypothetical protein